MNSCKKCGTDAQGDLQNKINFCIHLPLPPRIGGGAVQIETDNRDSWPFVLEIMQVPMPTATERTYIIQGYLDTPGSKDSKLGETGNCCCLPRKLRSGGGARMNP